MSVTKRTLGDYTIQPQANAAIGTRANTIVDAHTLIVNGNLEISGDYLAEIEANLIVKDSVVYIRGGGDDTGNTNVQDKGIKFDWWTPASVKKTGFFGFQDLTTYWTFIPDSTFDGNAYHGEYGTLAANIAGNLFLANGSAIRPSLSFISSNNSGIFYPESNAIGFSANGIDTARITQNFLQVFGNINATGNIAGDHIKVGTGGFTLGSDSTGLFFNGATKPTVNVAGKTVTEFYGQGASAVNYLVANNAITGQPISLLTSGNDTDIDFVISAKGSGNVIILPTLKTGTIYMSSLTVSGLAANSIPFTSTSNTLATSANLTFNDTTRQLTLSGNLTVNGNIAGNTVYDNGFRVLTSNSSFSNVAATDVTISGNAQNITANLKIINANVGTFGNTTHYPTFIVNDRGLVTAAGWQAAGPILVGNTGVGNVNPSTNLNIFGTQGISTSVTNSNVYIQNTGVTGIVTAANIIANAATGTVKITSNASLQDVTTVGATTANNVTFTSSSNTAVVVTGGVVANSLKTNSGNIWSGSGVIYVGNAIIANVGDPIASTDAVNKRFLANYVASNINTISYNDSFVSVNEDAGIGNILFNLDGNLAAYFTTTYGDQALNFINYVSISTGNLRVNSSSIMANGIESSLYANIPVRLQPKGTGQVVITTSANVANSIIVGGSISQVTTPIANIGNIKITQNTISSNIGNIALVPATGYVVSVSGTTALRIPTGTTAQRPFSNEEVGQIRYNTDYGFLEYFNGNTWVNAFNEISTETISPDGLSNTFTLSSSVTTEGALVSINGTVQRPGYAYTIAGNVITFVQTPTIVDIIEVRKLTTTYNPVISGDLVSDNANITINTVATIIDSFPLASYRSAKYFTSTNNVTFANSQNAEISLVHNGAAVSSSVYGTVSTDAQTLVNFSSNIGAGNVNLLATGVVAGSTIKIQKTYIAV